MSEQEALAKFEAAKAAAQDARNTAKVADDAAQAAGEAYRKACVEADAHLPKIRYVSVNRHGPDIVRQGLVLVRYTAKSIWTRWPGDRGEPSRWKWRQDHNKVVRWEESRSAGSYCAPDYITDDEAQAAIAAMNTPKGDEVKP